MSDVKFYVGLHQPSDAKHFGISCISINRLRGRKKPVICADVLVDSGAFTELNLYGSYRHSVDVYAAELSRLHTEGVVNITAAVAQDYMCEPFILEKTGLSISDHHRLTIDRYDALVRNLDARFDGACPFHVMPVLQGFAPQDYVNHIRQYGRRLPVGCWVGVGSVCKRQGDPRAIVSVLSAIKRERPDLRLHGFGVKKTALTHPYIRSLLSTADSMAWSFAARKRGGDANNYLEALAFAGEINRAGDHPLIWQTEMELFP